MKEHQDAALEAIAHTREAALFMREGIQKLLDLAEAANTPARLEVIELTDQQPKKQDAARETDLSIGLINPTDVLVWLGFGGQSASEQGRAIPIPANSAMVIPVSGNQLEIGADPVAIGAGNTLVVFLLRFKSVQLFHLWRF